MSALRGLKPLALSPIAALGLACIALTLSPVVFGQVQSESDKQTLTTQTSAHSETTVSLQDLLNEAEEKNPQIQAARQAWQSAEQVPRQVSALPDPQAVVQEFPVGSPLPFAGYTNSNFAYVGLGVSQDIPYPCKLKLKGEIAK